MDYRVIVTLGPACFDKEKWFNFIKIGVSDFRINTSHLDMEKIDLLIARLRRFWQPLPKPLSITLDLQGSKWRIGQLSGGYLQEGDIVELVFAQSSSQDHIIPIPHRDFFDHAGQSQGSISLNDAKISLDIIQVSQGEIRARVIKGGWISAKKGISLKDYDFRVEELSEKDQQILARMQDAPDIRFAISYVKDQIEMERYRNYFGKNRYLAAKIERKSAIDQAKGISEVADELWLCRGDLGAEIGLPAMAEKVAQFTRMLGEIRKPCLLAGQVLEYMTKSPTPTRSEVCYMYDALMNGYQGFVLSDETAIGDFPVESCQAALLFRGDNLK